MRRRALLAGGALTGLGGLTGCVSIGGGDAPATHHHRLHDSGAAGVAALPQPLVPALLIQAQPGDALADTSSIAFADAPQRFAFYQYAFWTERPVRQLPRLLQSRLQARGVAGAVGQAGDPLRADWLLTVQVDTIHHDVTGNPGQARLALTVALFDRRTRLRVDGRRFDAAAPVAQPSSADAAAAMSVAVAQCFDAVQAWLETSLAAAPQG